jgi:predicted house-cleaning NTP pyrophosphatase (Maf/HAM1 superfamily)
MARDTGNIGQKTQKKANKAKHTTQKIKKMSNTNHQITDAMLLIINSGKSLVGDQIASHRY